MIKNEKTNALLKLGSALIKANQMQQRAYMAGIRHSEVITHEASIHLLIFIDNDDELNETLRIISDVAEDLGTIRRDQYKDEVADFETVTWIYDLNYD